MALTEEEEGEIDHHFSTWAHRPSANTIAQRFKEKGQPLSNLVTLIDAMVESNDHDIDGARYKRLFKRLSGSLFDNSNDPNDRVLLEDAIDFSLTQALKAGGQSQLANWP